MLEPCSQISLMPDRVLLLEGYSHVSKAPFGTLLPLTLRIPIALANLLWKRVVNRKFSSPRTSAKAPRGKKILEGKMNKITMMKYATVDTVNIINTFYLVRNRYLCQRPQEIFRHESGPPTPPTRDCVRLIPHSCF